MPAGTIDHSFTATKTLGRASDPTYAGALSFMRRKHTKNVNGADAVVWNIPSTRRCRTGTGRASGRRRSAAPRRSWTTIRNIRSTATCSSRWPSSITAIAVSTTAATGDAGRSSARRRSC